MTTEYGKGLIPRDMKKYPVGYLGKMCEPFPFAPMSDSEIDDRLELMEREKATLIDVRNTGGHNGQPIPSTDQNGSNYCHTEDTEVLTNRGWCKWVDYNWLDPLGTVNQIGHQLEFQVPLEKHVYDYDGPMIYSTNPRVDFGVTPDHQMYVRKWNEKQRTLSTGYSFVRASDIGWYAGLMSAPKPQIGADIHEIEIPGDNVYSGDDFVKMLGLITSDGFAASYEHSGTLVSFCCFRDEVLEDVRSLARRIGFREQPSRPGVFNKWGSQKLAKWIYENCYCGKPSAHTKQIPQIVKELSVRQLNLFFEWFNDRSRDMTQFFSVSKKLIDDLQDVHLRLGKRSRISDRPAKDIPFEGNKSGVIKSSKLYHLSVYTTEELSIERKKYIETERYKGPIFCAGVPNHTLITRRNGTVLISSNCWAHSTISAMLLLRAKQGLPYQQLNAYSVAVPIKRGANQGGWCQESLEYAAEHGVCTTSTWPFQKMSMSCMTPEAEAERKIYRISEWWDGGDDPRLFWTALAMGMPVVSDYSDWSHSVCAIFGSRKNKTSKIWNSWSDGWGANGIGAPQSRTPYPQNWMCPRVVTA